MTTSTQGRKIFLEKTTFLKEVRRKSINALSQEVSLMKLHLQQQTRRKVFNDPFSFLTGNSCSLFSFDVQKMK